MKKFEIHYERTGPGDVCDVCHMEDGGTLLRQEFTFYDRKAHISETNLRIAKDELARWTASLMGIPVERPLPAEYVYAAFNGHTVQFYEQIGGNAWNGS